METLLPHAQNGCMQAQCRISVHYLHLVTIIIAVITVMLLCVVCCALLCYKFPSLFILLQQSQVSIYDLLSHPIVTLARTRAHTYTLENDLLK
jgi:hypothetical protein